MDPFGFSNPTARFDRIEGSVLLDKADLTKSSISVTLPLDSLDTGVAKLDEALKGRDFLDAAKYTTITFKSTKIEQTGENGQGDHDRRRPLGPSPPAQIEGHHERPEDVELLLHGK